MKKHLLFILIILIVSFCIRFNDNPTVPDYYVDDNNETFLYGYDAYSYYGIVYKDQAKDIYSKSIRFLYEKTQLSITRSMILLNMFIFALVLILIYIITYKFTKDENIAFLAGIFLGINGLFYTRSFIGWADNDLIVMLHTLVVVLLFTFIIDANKAMNGYKVSCMLLLMYIVSGAFSKLWSGYFYIYFIIFLFVGLYIIIREGMLFIAFLLFLLCVMLLIFKFDYLGTILSSTLISENQGLGLFDTLKSLDWYFIVIYLVLGAIYLLQNYKRIQEYLFFLMWFCILFIVSVVYFKATFHLILPYAMIKSVVIKRVLEKNAKKVQFKFIFLLIVLSIGFNVYDKGNPVMNRDIYEASKLIDNYPPYQGNIGNWWDNGVFYNAFSHGKIIIHSDDGWSEQIANYLITDNESRTLGFAKEHQFTKFIISRNEMEKWEIINRSSNYNITKNSMINRLWYNHNLSYHHMLYENNYLRMYAINHTLD